MTNSPLSRRLRPVLAISLTGLTLLGSQALADTAPLAFPNNGFESGLDGWIPSPEDTAAKASQVTPGAAHTGQAGLEVKATTAGSWLQGPRLEIESGKSYRISFWAKCVSTSGVGIFANFFGEDAKPTGKTASMQVPSGPADWTEFHLDVTAPPAATGLRVAIHAFTKQPTEADFDDFTITPVDATAEATPAPTPASTAKSTVGNSMNWPPPPPLPALDPARVKEIAASLDLQPKGIGPSLDDRKPWEAMAADKAFHDIVLPRAERFMTEPTPEISNDQWMESCRTSDRKAESFLSARRFRITTMLMAEGMENKGRFLPAIEKEIIAICKEPTWVLPAHDKTMANYNGTQKFVDLGAGMTSWTLATADSILSSHLSAETHNLIKEQCKIRVIDPYLAESRGETHLDWWRTNGANWNAVVHAGVTGAALALDDSVDERAQIVASDEKETPFYLNGFPADGYALEGMGYWTYGFGHYITMAEAVLNATHGKVNLYADAKARLVAQFPLRFEVVPGIYPAYGDSPFNQDPPVWLYTIVNGRYGLGQNITWAPTVDATFSPLLYAIATNLTFDTTAKPLFTDGAEFHGHRLRDWFADGQVLVGRMPEGKTGLSFSFKGGNNGTSHNHDDLGTFLLLNDKQPLLVDPGSTVYGSTTFTDKRYTNQIINSYGHSVPYPAMTLQGQGPEYAASVASTSFTDDLDSVTIDLTKAYPVADLKKLTRQFDYSRVGEGSLTITDAVEFGTAQAFGTALATFSTATEVKPGTWSITQNGKTVQVEITSEGGPFTVTNEQLKDEVKTGAVHRLGINFNAPVTSGTIKMVITPQATATGVTAK